VLGSKRFGEELQAKFEAQDSRCFYTEEKLTPGANAALDHQIPITRGGTSTLDNLRWTTVQINRVKNDLSHDDFVRLCTKIAVRFALP
jgi:5-methylcytosine-specific restriction endonuclease McrA